MCLGCMPNTGINVSAYMHKNYLKTKVFMQKKQVPVERLKEILCSTLIQPHVDHAYAAWYPDRPILQLASFEDTFTKGMRLEIRMQNSTAKKCFA